MSYRRFISCISRIRPTQAKRRLEWATGVFSPLIFSESIATISFDLLRSGADFELSH